MKKKGSLASRMNVVRAAVMGANDGILSVAGIVLGVAGANSSNYEIFLAGISGMIAGTVSMAMGEYVSVNTQKDSQAKAVVNQKIALGESYEHEENFVQQKYLDQGIKPTLALKATKEMMKKDALQTTVRERYGFNLNEYSNPYSAAIASMISFPLGSILPLVAITTAPEAWKTATTFLAVAFALAITGYSAAALNGSKKARGLLRNIVAGAFTMIITFVIGKILG